MLAVLDSDLAQSTIPAEQLGRSAAGVRDIDGDGIPDVVGGAPFYSLSDGNGRMCAFYLKPQPNQPPVADANGPYSITTVGGCGPCDVSLTVTDSHGATDTDTTTVTIVDITPPSIADLNASPNLLWPPNHKLVSIAVNYKANDNCGAPTCTLSATSNEPDNGLGDGDTAPDWLLSTEKPLEVNLRAERSGKGIGRVYTITVICKDASGNPSIKGTTTVTVPHDQK